MNCFFDKESKSKFFFFFGGGGGGGGGSARGDVARVSDFFSKVSKSENKKKFFLRE